ncbi:Calx-beta domain-containing protein, partial [Kangiella spongicola]|uniref:Calx-beta domain-containing protein n=1 Tax=Kangiella spongicola TaxID=796379 RepID=UPI0014748B1E
MKLASKSALGLFALLMTVNAHAVDYPSTIDNTVNVTLPAGVIDNNTANNQNGGCSVADPTVAACATDTNSLNVVTPEPTKSFSPSVPIDFNGFATLTITLTNTNNFVATLQADFVDNLPAGVFLATPANASKTCGGSGVLTAVDGGSSITLGSGATIPANSSCTITATVTSNSAGTHTNQLPAGALDTGMGPSSPASADLVVDPPAELIITGTPQPETNSGTTTFTYTVSINNGINTTEDITFDYFTTDGTAEAGTDYIGIVDGSVSGIIPAGSSSTTFNVTVYGDTVTEPDETFDLSLSNISSNAVAAPGTHTATILNDDSASIAIEDVTVNEADGTITVNVTLTGSTSAAFDVDFATADGSATAGLPAIGDYGAASGTLSFAGNDGEVQQVSVTIYDDIAIEGDETFDINLSNITGGLATIADATGVVTIQDNDSVVLAEFDSAADSADESITDAPRLLILGVLPNDATINVNVTGGTATGSGTDYTNVVSVTIPAGTYDGGQGTSIPINLTVVDDNILESDENITFELTSANPRLILGDADLDSNTQATNTYTIQDNDPITVSVAANDATAAEPADNGQFTITLSNPNSVDTTVTYAVSGTATATDDYTALTGTVTIPAGDTTATVDVAVVDDNIVENDETVILTLSTTSDGTIDAGNNQATVTIADDDDLVVSISANDPTAAEPADNGQFTVSLTNTSSTDTTVTYVVAGTATATDDYTPLSGTVVVPAGSLSATVDVLVVDDNLVEVDETVVVTLDTTSTGTIDAANDDATVTISDDDTASIDINSVTVNEADGTASFNVTLTGEVQGGFSVDFASNDATAEAGSDYVATSGTLTFAGTAGEVEVINVTINDDSLLEATETFEINLSNSSNTAVSINTPQGIGTITDNDAASIVINDVTVDESGPNAIFTVTLTGNVQGGFTVDYATADDTATAGSDYTATSNTLTFAGNNGETQTFSVPITDDGLAEATETFFANLSNISNTLVTIADAQGVGSITDNDNASLAIDDVTVNEAAGTAEFTVTLTGDVQGGVTVDFATADDTALAGSDYVANSNTLTFAGTNGETQTISVDITNDSLVEATESFFVNLSNVNNAVVTLSDAQGVGTITDNDSASLAIDDVTVNEAAGTAEFTVTLTGDVQDGVSVDFATADDTANAGSDYTANSGTLNFAGTTGETQTVQIDITDDAVAEASETYFVNLSNVSSTLVTLSDSQGLGTITDNDTASLTINNVTINENGGSATYSVTLDNAVQGGSVVNYSFTDGTATGGVDYDNTTGSVTFAGTAGETQTFTVDIFNDAIYEGDETFTVNINAVNPVINDTDSATTIIDDEVLDISISASIANASEPGTDGEFTINLSSVSATDTTINLSYSGTANDPADYGLSSSGTGTTTVVIPAGSSSATVDVVVVNDTIVEPTETVVATIDSVSQGNITTATATVNIADDDTAAVTIEDVSESEGVGSATFTITLNNDVAGGTNVSYSFTDGTATGGGTDYDSTAGSVSFTGTAGETRTFSVTYNDDNLVEGDETFAVSLSADNAAVTDTDTATGTIVDNDILTIDIAASVATASEPATDGEFTITMSNPSATDTDVFVSYAGTATDGADYNLTGTSGTTTVTIPAGSTTATVAVEVLDDSLVEGSETVDATVTAVSNGNIGTATGTVTINDNDSRVTVEDVSVNESDGFATFTITLEEAIAGGTDVTYSFTDGTATGGVDYDNTGGTVNFTGTAGETRTFNVAITNDAIVEGDETFTVNLSASNPNVIDTDTAVGTIVDNDALTVSVVATTPTAQEPATNGEFTVSLSTTSASDTTVTVAYSGTATSGTDYNLTGANGTTTVVIPAGSTDAVISVDVIDDNIVEGDETVVATITNTDQGTISNASDTVTIESEDTASVTVEDVTVSEAGSPATFRVTLNGEVAGGTDVTYSFTDGSATGGVDYDNTGGTVSFTGNDGEFVDVDVSILQDAIVEFDETFTFNMSASNTLVDASDVAVGTITDDDTPLVTSITATSPNASEPATNGVFTVSLSAESSTDTVVTIDYTGTANDPADYNLTGASGTTTVTVPAGSMSATVDVSVVDDNLLEGDENVVATITSVSNGYIGNASDTVTISDDDNAAVTIADVTESEGAGFATFTITLDNAVAGGTVVNYSFTDGTATGGNTDYDSTSGSVTFTGTAGEQQTFTVAITDDGIVEGNETFTVNLDAVNPLVTDSDTATGTITDNDNLVVSVSASVAAASEGGPNGEFTVSLNTVSATDTTVTLSYAGTATDTADYTLTGADGTTSVVIPAGSTTATVAVNVVNDSIVEPTETVVATIDAVSNGTVGNASDTVNITDNDAATVTVNDVTENEAAGSIDFTVTLNGDVAGGVSFDYTTNDGTATAGSDYTTTSGTRTFAGTNGETITISVPITNDTIVEDNETFTLDLSNLTKSGVTFSDDQGLGTITDNDSATVAVSDVTVAEDGINADFVVTLNGDVQDGVSFNYTTNDGTALAGSDYTATSGTQTFTGNDGETIIISVPITNDTIVEDNETFTLDLSNLTSTSVSFSDDQGLGTITDNDSASVEINDVTIAEDGVNAVFTVTLTGDVQDGFTLNYTSNDGSATAGSDYTTASGSLSFTGTTGETHTITVPITNDTTVEGDETFTVDLSGLSNASVTFSDAQGLGTITDNDSATVSVNDVTVDESTATADFTVTLSGDVQGGVSFNYTTNDGTATAGSDYTAVSGTETFVGNLGESITISVPILEDTLVEGSENFTLDLSALTNSSVTFSDDQGLGTITDNDNAAVTIEDVTVNENATNAVFTITLNNDVAGGTDVTYSFTDVTATGGNVDYDSTSGTVTFVGTAGETQQFNVAINDDTIVEGTETFNVALSASNSLVDDSDGAVGTINDNDSLVVSVAATAAAAAEGGANGEFTVSLNTVSATDTTVTIGYTGSATSPSDYSLTGANGTTTVVIPAGSTSATINVGVVDDNLLEGDETVIATISSVSNGTIGTATDTVTITDNDVASVTIEDVTVNEAAGNANFTITLNGSVAGGTDVTYSFTDGTATGGNTDYDSTSGTVTFAGTDGETQTFNVAITNDTIVEGDETFTINLSASNALVTDTDTAIGTITDDDAATVTVNDVTENEAAGSIDFTVTLNGDVVGGVSFDYTTNDGTATAGSDYTTTSGTRTFAGTNGETITISVPITNDTTVEDNETFTLDLSNLTKSGVTFSDAQGLGTITDNDSATVAVSDVTVAEDGVNADFVVTLTGDVQDGVSFNYTTNDGTALAGSDYTATSGTQTFTGNDGETIIISVPITNDTIVEDNETFTLDLSNLTSTSVSFSDDQGLGTITDNDSASVEINDVTIAEDGVNAVFTVTLTGDVQDGFTLNYTSNDGSATAGSDYTTASGSLSFTGTTGETHTITVPITNDTTVEGDETFTVDLSGLSNASVTFSDAQGLGTITDNDSATVSVNDVTVDESTATADFTVTLSGDVQGGVSFNYTTNDGTATAGSDYTAVSGTETFVGNLGESITISVPILEDTLVEGSENFTLDLSALTNSGVTFSDAQGLGTITDNDNAAVTINDMTVDESDGTATFTVTLDNEVVGGTVVNYSFTNGTATGGDDFDNTAGSVVFVGTPGETQTFNVTIFEDTIVEGTETFTVNIDAVNPLVTDTDTGLGTITDNDNLVVSVAATTAAASEPNVDGEFTVSLNTTSSTATTVTIGYTGSATDTSDYTLTGADGTTSVVIPAGATTALVTVDVIDDLMTEGDETVVATISSVSNGTIGTATDTVTISDNDSSEITIEDVSVNEADGNATFTITLNGALAGGTDVNYSFTDGSATGGNTDYDSTGGTVTFTGNDGEQRTFLVPITNDTIVEGNETFTVNIDAVNPLVIDTDTAIGTIVDNDTLSVSIAATLAAAAEPATDGEFTVSLNTTSATDTTVTIDYTGSATATSDYNLTGANGTTTVVIPAGSTTATVAVEVIDDSAVEGDETVIGTISAVSNGTISTASDTVTISDDDRNLDIAPITESTPENTAHTTAPADLSPGDTPVGTVLYSISGGADAALFTIDPATGELTLPAQDFEAPADADSNNVYEVQITATDGAGNTADELATVTVTDVTETANLDLAPIAESTPENAAHTTAPADLSPGDAPVGTVTYTITGGADAALFTIDPATGELTLPAQDFEAPADANADNVYEVQITATDSDNNTADELATVTVTDVTETANLDLAPIAESTPENAAHTTAPADLSPGDAPVGTVTYTITGGADAALFTIDSATGELTLPAQDFEAPADANADNVYEVQITATDSDNNTADELATVTVTDV